MINFIKIISSIVIISLLGACSLGLTNSHDEPVKFQLAERSFLGDEKAPNTVVVVQDFECVSCKSFYKETYKSVLENELINGEVKVYEFNLGFESNVSYLKSMLSIGIDEVFPELSLEASKWFYELDNDSSKKLLDRSFLNQELNNKFGKNYNFDSILTKVFSDDDGYKKKLDINNQMVDYLGITTVPKVYVNGVKMNSPDSYAEFKSLLNIIKETSS